MKKLFDFECTDCSLTFSELTEYKKESKCPECGALAHKLISTPKIHLEGWSGSFPGAASKWTREHKKLGNPSSEEK